jgi:hypothetical protein
VKSVARRAPLPNFNKIKMVGEAGLEPAKA